jgi:hypothetical protein
MALKGAVQSRLFTHEAKGSVAGQLQPAHCQELDEVPQVQARGSGIKTAVERDGRAREQTLKLLLFRGDMNQPPPNHLLPYRLK